MDEETAALHIWATFSRSHRQGEAEIGFNLVVSNQNLMLLNADALNKS